ncbi:hypothetical protein ACG0Z6_10050 [Roseateles sp. BYS180W]|uniref:Nucleotidyltransferase n=1 Tax=Roseateles rivi TaxID=3299028 RepID=A0ABW7FW79_9BURK
MNANTTLEIAATAARLIVEEGLEWGPAKTRAVKLLGLPARTALPNNEQIEAQVREYIALFCADTQPAELLALRELAARWMARLAEFRPHLCGAVWRGTATRLSSVHLQLYCDDTKSTEITLINQGLDYDVGQVRGPRGQNVDCLVLHVPCPALGESIPLALTILDKDDLRGALKPDAQGLTERGDLHALQRLLQESAPS